LTHSTPVGLTIQAKPDFTISANPTSVSFVSGGNGSSTITLTTLNGYNKSVALTVLSGCPSGATCSLSPANVIPTGNSTLTISGGTAAAGSYTLTVQGSDGTLTHTTTVDLTIQPDFTISVNPTSLSVVRGSSGPAKVTIAQAAGGKPVLLSVTGLPANVVVSFTPLSVTNGTSTMTVIAKATAAPGTYDLVIHGTNASATHTVDLTLTIQ
jgi:hypothetical protein